MRRSLTRSADGTIPSRPRAVVHSAPSTTYTATTPMTVKSSEPSEMDAWVDAPSATTGATAEEEDVVEDAGTTVALAKGGMTGLARTAGRTSLTREVGGISLVRIARTATQASLLCHHRQGGMKTSIRTRGLGASRSCEQLLAPWRSSSPSLSTHLQAVLPRSECSPPQA